MDLRSNSPYWLLKHGIVSSYPSLSEDISTEIAVMGGGISGALTAWHLQQAGFDVVLTDRRHIGMGSTAASTALLQYEIDVPLRELIKLRGEKDAVRSYMLCHQSIYSLQEIAKRIGLKEMIHPRPSFQYASYKKDTGPLREEYTLRKKAGIKIQWLEEKDIISKFGFSKPGGVLSEQGASLDPYAFTHGLIRSGIRKGMQVYDHTEITGIHHKLRGVELMTADGHRIKAKKLVIACGYESQQYIPFKIQELQSTFAIVSEPLPTKDFWHRNALIWETAEPYLYMRTTADNRVLIGGRDIESSNPAKRDLLLAKKAKELEEDLNKLFPDIPFKMDFMWAGSFGTTKDGLPYIGSIKQRPHTLFALGLGGNGITFSQIAAELIRYELLKKKNPDARVFSFDR